MHKIKVSGMLLISLQYPTLNLSSPPCSSCLSEHFPDVYVGDDACK